MRVDVNQALKVYLGADERGGYQPGDGSERLRQAFPREWGEMLAELSKYLNEDHVPDWSARDLSEETRRFASSLKSKFPELNDVIARALANRWSFGWR
jgi:hypothetical protein